MKCFNFVTELSELHQGFSSLCSDTDTRVLSLLDSTWSARNFVPTQMSYSSNLNGRGEAGESQAETQQKDLIRPTR